MLFGWYLQNVLVSRHTQHHADDPSIVDAARIEGIENAVFLEGDQ
jgi:hypothetical protein